MFSRKKKLFEQNPKELSLELLSTLQGSLVAKLILVNTELQSRYRTTSTVSAGLANSERPRKLLSDSADHLEQFNGLLSAELARITKRDSGGGN